MFFQPHDEPFSKHQTQNKGCDYRAARSEGNISKQIQYFIVISKSQQQIREHDSSPLQLKLYCKFQLDAG